MNAVTQQQFEELAVKVSIIAKESMIALLSNPEYVKRHYISDEGGCLFDEAAADGWDAAQHFMDKGAEIITELAMRHGITEPPKSSNRH